MSPNALKKVIETAASGGYSKETLLPGPTGEINARFTLAKPPIFYARPGAQSTETQANTMTALGGVAVKATEQVSAEDLKHLAPLGAVIWWGDATTAQAFDQALAARDGPILALITGHPDSTHVLFEQHVCIDTTAAGGNATLLRGDS